MLEIYEHPENDTAPLQIFINADGDEEQEVRRIIGKTKDICRVYLCKEYRAERERRVS